MRMFLLPRMSDQMQLPQGSLLRLPPCIPMSHSSAVAVYGNNVVWVGSQVPSLSTYVPTRHCEHRIVWTLSQVYQGRLCQGYKGLKAVNLDFVSEASEEITVRYTGGPWKLHNAAVALGEG